MATRKDKVQIVVGAKDKTGKVLSGIKSQLLAVGGAYAVFAAGKEVIGESISAAVKYEATIKSLESVVTATGRNINEVYAEMETHLGGLADKAQIAEGFLKGMTTELSAQQVSKLTAAVKDASIAMGEDFGVQLPLIIKAIKQLNPAILDNIGVTVRLDVINKRIRDGYYGAGTAITEYTQQNAIFQEVVKQTMKFQGQEEKLLGTTKGAWQQLSVEWRNAQLQLGEGLNPVLQEGISWIAALMGATVGYARAVGPAFLSIGFIVDNTVDLMVNSLQRGTTVIELNAKAVAEIAKGNFGLAAGFAASAAIAAKQGAEDTSDDFDKVKESVEFALAAIDSLWDSTWDGMADKYEEFTARFRAASGADGTPPPLIPGLTPEAVAQNQELMDIIFEASLLGKEEHIQELLALERDYDLIVREIEATKDADDETRREALLSAEMIFKNDRAAIWQDYFQNQKTETAKTYKYIEQQTQRLGNAVRGTIHDIVRATDKGTVNMQQMWNELGAKVRAILLDMVIDAIFKVIAATGKNIIALAAEKVATMALTQSYVSLAAAKAAASLGATAPASIAGAAAVKGALVPMLLGFDDPINDEIAMKHGRDYARFFMRGARDSFGSPRFGLDVTQAIGQATTVPTGAGGGLTINFNAPVTDEEYVQQTIVPIIEQAAIDGGSRLLIDADTVTGEASVNIG